MGAQGALPSTHGVDARTNRPSFRLLAYAAGVGGWVFAAVVAYGLWSIGRFTHPSGDVADIFLPAGATLLAGGDPYAPGVTPAGRPFLYAPPWAVLFGIVAPLGAWPVHLGLSGLEMLALRCIAGSWLRAGVFCWFPLVPWEIASGQLDLLVAAAIVAAIRRTPGPAAVMCLAKLTPILAVDGRDARRFLAVLVAMGVISMPWLTAWGWWVSGLVTAAADPVGPQVPLPWIVRGPIALAFVGLGRPWSRAFGAALFTPNLYWSSLVVFVAVVPFMGPLASQPRRLARRLGATSVASGLLSRSRSRQATPASPSPVGGPAPRPETPTPARTGGTIGRGARPV